MNLKLHHFRTWCLFSAMTPLLLQSAYSQETFYVPVDPNQTLGEVVATISHAFNTDSEGYYLANFRVTPDISYIQIAKKMNSRSYEYGATDSQKADIAYILTTLAYTSLVKLKTQESSLKKAGDRIDSVHPFRFLEAVFTNEELKVAMRNLEGRSWVWKDFLEGITKSLAEEYQASNLLQYVNDFAANIKLDVGMFSSYLENQKWKEFVELLIKIVPREGPTDKYNM